MKIDSIETIKSANRENISLQITNALKKLDGVRPVLARYIDNAIITGKLESRISKAVELSQRRGRTNPQSKTSDKAGAYFLNEDVYGPVYALTRSDEELERISLGPGVSLIEPPSMYGELLLMGQNMPSLAVNYTAEAGTPFTMKAMKQMMDARIDLVGNYFPESGVYLTQGATEAIDLFMEMLSQQQPGSNVVFLGPSYYTGPFAAAQKRLSSSRVLPKNFRTSEQTKFFPTAEDIEAALTPNTKALALTTPNNPNGETYSDIDLRKILSLAKKKDLLILYDSIFENMYFDDSKNYQSRLLQIAAEIGALDQVIVVDSLSKTQNIPGARIGFLATTNQNLRETLDNIIVARRCNPPLVEQPLIQFESLARRIKTALLKNPQQSIDSLINFYMEQDTYSFSQSKFKSMYMEWDDWNISVKTYYQANLELVRGVLKKITAAGSPTEAAFNTFVKLSGIPEGTNSNDFLAKLMFTLATYTQNGACFGLPQEQWDTYLGLWIRISYASNREDLIEGLLRLIVFTEKYISLDLGNPEKYP
ncbi:MAG: pyridoxal phosphate-dependent aminotransferase, partial [Patescibacteria group bacterium]|nr:pyridoxal phosphate-dependent aminotransferase [Patescibacteria group bacterium]